MADTACDRVFHVQRTLASMDGPSHGPRAIAREAGLNKSTVHRILNSGLAYDVFVRDGAGKYRLGSGAVGLGMRAAAYRFSEAPQRRILAQLLHEANGMLCAIESLTPLTSARRRTEQYVARSGVLAEPGAVGDGFMASARSLRAGAAGRVLLSGLPNSVQRAVAAEELPASLTGPGYIQDPGEFLRVVGHAASHGIAVSREEVRASWCAVAAPIGRNVVMGAVVVAKPYGDMTADAAEEIACTREAAARISDLLAEASAA
ncbi:IclR family transcriptional regulator C-terminal domain-containing protein [Streptomyces sp. SPB4]|uniref:IclR family transcriptional regulator domain-containing protein n=1 Tax=Streptomyces sp. SPB4 TaxID=2940553 RepID=UPI002474DDEC|nr:IclR family transcriptional regulator C-terminal domain-containing protein [Streptomyces sp. SPB4]MDH6538018.1 DNA-binding IclR family transcriptional regulator [Streptomyces sp. SPB4]